jgi:hypothetical protein
MEHPRKGQPFTPFLVFIFISFSFAPFCCYTSYHFSLFLGNMSKIIFFPISLFCFSFLFFYFLILDNTPSVPRYKVYKFFRKNPEYRMYYIAQLIWTFFKGHISLQTTIFSHINSQLWFLLNLVYFFFSTWHFNFRAKTYTPYI